MVKTGTVDGGGGGEEEHHHFPLLQIVGDRLDKQSTVEYEKAVQVMKIIVSQPDNPQCVAFWNKHVYMMVRILLDQRPHLLGMLEKSCVEDTTMMTVRLLDHYPLRMDLVLRIFDARVNFYSGSRSNYQNFLGAPELRLTALKVFAESMGFETLREQWCPDGSPWPPTSDVLIVVKAMKDAGKAVLPETCSGLESYVINHLLNMSEEQLKKESTDHLSSLMFQLMNPKNSALSVDELHKFWLRHTLKVMQCNSIVLKLYAWDQMNEIIREALRTKPYPLEYVVLGAGSPGVNGVYKAAFKAGEPQYVKPHSDSPRSPELTILRCSMRTKQKWWFISETDPIKPGTDSDVDYYHHKSVTEEQEREPPLHGWSIAGTTGCRGVHPAPILESRGYYCPDGVTLDSFLIFKVAKWIEDSGVLGLVFETTMHRELVSRSRRLLLFLAETNSLTEKHLKLIWKCGIQSHDNEIADEVQALLCALSLRLSPPLYQTLMDLLTSALTSEEGGKEAREHRFGRVVVFIEKFQKEFSRSMFQLTPENGLLFLGLIWTVYRSPLLESSKSLQVMEELLSLGFIEGWESAFLMMFVTECVEKLEEVARLPAKEVHESQVSRLVQALIFLLSHQCSRRLSGLVESNTAEVLHGELARFVKAQRSVCVSGRGDLSWYQDQIQKRLRLIRTYYGFSTESKMSQEVVIAIWNLLSHSAERNELFVFFNEAGTRANSMEAAFTLTDCIYIFKEMICSPDVDWSHSSQGMYTCFGTYSNGMRKVADADALRPLSLETLWRITLATPLDGVAETAIGHLLKSYSSLDANLTNDLLARVFSNLSEIDEKIRTSASGKTVIEDSLSQIDIRRVSRCLSILNNAISDGSGSILTPHLARSNMNRIRISVICRIQPVFVDARTQKKATEQLIGVDIHPMSTIGNLKKKICSFVEGSKPDRMYLNFDNRYISASDNVQLSSLGIVDGSEIAASINLNNYSLVSVNYDDDYDDYNKPKDSECHLGNVISRHSLYFDVLISLLDVFTNSETRDPTISETAKSIWKIMMAIPTQPDMLNSVMDCARGLPPASTEDWARLLGREAISTSAKMTYILQIVDGVIQPAVENPGETVTKESFVESGGFSAVLKFFLSTPVTSSNAEFRNISDVVALHIIYFCLFGAEKGVAPPTLVAEVQRSAADMVRTLLSVANYAAGSGQAGTVQDALFTLMYLLQSPDVAEQLTSNPQARSLLTSVLRHESKKVRDMAADFAAKVGQTQKVVFDWLLAEVDVMPSSELNCEEIFTALTLLLVEQQETLVGGPELRVLASTLSNKLMKFPRTDASNSYPAMLVGCMSLLKNLIEIDILAFNDTELGKDLVNSFLGKFLFAMPSRDVENRALCTHKQSRRTTFAALSAFLHQRPENYPVVLTQLKKLLDLGTVQLRQTWNVSAYQDHKRSLRTGFVGLKNQGCTCYSNALLQQLFMNVPFRNAIMSTPLRSSHRSTLWHVPDEELVGKELLVEWDGGIWKRALVVLFDRTTCLHVIRYLDLNGAIEEELQFNIRGGYVRVKKETGRVRLRVEAAGGGVPSESEAAAYRILEQLQRTFCYLENSKQPYFDPRPLIEACKTLNLNYNIYHQNDASEFCDQLLDRLETAMRGKHSGVDIWKKEVLTNVFGGGMLYQKIPQECEFYETDRLECGHWQSTREESFLKCELIIRGKENIEESLAQLVEGELMNGDNKIMCEKCNQKKDTMRRTCFDVLPNTLIVHLKRFDLDFQTFETVKLNNKIAFPNRLSMFKYTKEGMEEAEKAKNLSEGGTNSAPELTREPSEQGPSVTRSNSVSANAAPEISKEQDLSEYEYELQGVLVHAGMAQGGHYYSFIRDISSSPEAEGKSGSEKWYRFDDEDVTNFNPENIPANCFGGTYQTSTVGMHDIIEEDRSANALMLFFRKVKPSSRKLAEAESAGANVGAGAGAGALTNQVSSEEVALINALDPLVDGYQAFEREVWEANMKHLVAEYVLDTDLHNFVRNILSSICVSSTLDDSFKALNFTEVAINEITAFGCQFFVDIVLHCRDRSGVKLWLETINAYFTRYPTTAEWFLSFLMNVEQCSWLRDYLLYSTDSTASSSFVSIIVMASAAVVESFSTKPGVDVETAIAPVLSIVDNVLDMLPLVPLNWRNADEVFIAMRELAAIPQVAEYLVKKDVVAKLCFFAIPDQVPAQIGAIFKSTTSAKDFSSFVPIVMEVIAALLGVPQSRRAVLIEEDPNTLLQTLTPLATAVLTNIFRENCTLNANKMDHRDVYSYMDKIYRNQKQASLQTRTILDRYADKTSCLYLEGFLQHYTKTAVYNPKSVWRDITTFGYQHDLTKPTASDLEEAAVATSSYSPASDSLMRLLPPASRECLLKLGLYEAAMYDAETNAIAVAKRVCFDDPEASSIILEQGLKRLSCTMAEFLTTETELNLSFIRAILALEDDHFSSRMRDVVFGDYGYLTRYYLESQRRAGTLGRHGYQDFKSRADTYLKQFKILWESSPAAKEWVQEHVLRDPTHAWLLPSIQRSRGTGIEFDEYVTRKVVIVSGSGVPEVDGRYEYHKPFNFACMFRKEPIKVGNRDVSFLIYRCRLNGKGYAWYISYVENGGNPCGNNDVDFYTAPSSYQDGRDETNDLLPPVCNWEPTSTNGILPSPILTIHDPDSFDDSEDRDDSMAVIDDGSSSQTEDDRRPTINLDSSMEEDFTPDFDTTR